MADISPDVLRVVSVNAGKVQDIHHDNRVHSTGIVKRPARAALRLDREGVEGDEIANPEFHGGADQAVYAYSLSDYQWWQAETGREMRAGLFGENLTVSGLPTYMAIGDRLLIGTAVLEATGPRIPCAKLGAVMEDAEFPTIFMNAARPGVYFRVLSPGSVRAGDVVDYVPDTSSTVSTLDVFNYYYDKSTPPDALKAALATPLATRLREKFARRVAHLQA